METDANFHLHLGERGTMTAQKMGDTQRHGVTHRQVGVIASIVKVG